MEGKDADGRSGRRTLEEGEKAVRICDAGPREGIVRIERHGTLEGDDGAECNRENAPKVLSYGLATGGFSGFFGIGGGFLIVPGLIASTGMPMINAVGTSLVAVTAFGLTTAANYALSGMVDWLLAGVFIAGGLIGSIAGTRAAKRLSSSGQLTTIFAVLIFVVAAYMLWKSAGAIF